MKYLNIPTFILSIVAIVFCGFIYTHPSITHLAGAVNSSISAGFDTNLTAPIQSTDTSMSLASNIVNSAEYLPNGYTCFTIDVSTPAQEYACGTVTGSNSYGVAISVTGLQRGVSWVTATTTISSIAQYHTRGADVRISDWPQIGRNANELNGSDTIPNELQYANTVFIQNTDASTTIPTKYYVDNAVVSGAPNATVSVKGIIQLATAAQQASSTSLGSTGAFLVPMTGNATDTPQAKCNSLGSANGAGCLTVALLDGKISQAWIDLTQPFIFTGSITSTATTTIAASNINSDALILNGAHLQFPSSNSFGFLENNGSGVLSYVSPSNQQYTYATTTASLATSANAGFASSTPMTIAAGTLTASSTISFQGDATDCQGSTTCTFFLWAKIGSTWTKIAGGTIGAPVAGRNWDMTWYGKVFNNSATNSQISVMNSNALDEANVSTSAIAGKNLTQTLTSAVDTTQAITLVGVIGDSSAGGNFSFNSLLITVAP